MEYLTYSVPSSGALSAIYSGVEDPDAGNLLDIIGSKILVIVVVMDVVAYIVLDHIPT